MGSLGICKTCDEISERDYRFGLYYDGSHEYRLYNYMDVDWAGSVSDRKSTSGGCYSLGYAMISWFNKK